MARGTCGMLPTRVGLTHLIMQVGLRPINASAGISQRFPTESIARVPIAGKACVRSIYIAIVATSITVDVFVRMSAVPTISSIRVAVR